MKKRYLILSVMLIALGLVSSAIVPAEASEVETLAQSTAQVDCPVENFMDVSMYVQTQDYAVPTLNIYCEDDLLIVESNGITNYLFEQITPNNLQSQTYRWQIPLNPVEAAAPSDIPLLGPIAIAVNGLPIFGPNEAPVDDYGDPFLDQILDYCNGHTAHGGVYHYHARPNCLFTDTEGTTSLVIGYAFDGYPILTPYQCVDSECTSVEKVESSWQRTSDVRNAWEAHKYVEGSGDLDECNGTYLPDGSYAYFATDTFPYFLGCYHGEAATNGLGAGNNAPAGQGPQAGNGSPPQGAPPRGQDGRPPRR